ncbi:type III-B CRISPR module-associated protein Cmr3 [Saccharibacillus sp. CPCC 101409]|uniref:type III-B CRISPR module-associated protein Cmr3 n=1 Tax=Saccharibacillus sp. CPCC 101409 TaxID=3058041 RepID=UPI002671E912|nr:type III-B CRISPR module-associated protein Cmr3 [Saccharibacillus sp. CPCC 101409]MDO3411202.1 type III-B CRISPR module-associated protein Cmr3 [Saccharibacillus sp. CPCC 101409]
MKKRLQASPLDPILVRDGRPFDAVPGIRAHTLSDVMPSTFAGSLRTLLIKKEPDAGRHDAIKKLKVRGPLYRLHGSLYFTAPQDIEFYEKDGESGSKSSIEAHRINPVNRESGDYGESGFWGIGKEGRLEDKLWLPLGAGTHKRLKSSPAYVSEDWMLEWLTEQVDEKKSAKQVEGWSGAGTDANKPSLFLHPFVREERTHTAIDPERYTAKDQRLFSTESLVFPDGMTLEAEVEGPDTLRRNLNDFSELHTLGGKRRLVHFGETEAGGAGSVKEHGSTSFWDCPSSISEALQGKRYVRMVLATPAFFRKGWIPGWLDEQLVSKESLSEKVKLQLRWACIPRWQPVSGWAYSGEKGPQARAVRRMAPAGSVYFFEVVSGDPAELARDKWLQSVSDLNRRAEAHDAEDGFGLALWGSWTV